MNLGLEGVAQYTPHTISLGASYKFSSVLATAELRYALWHLAPNPATLVAVDLNGELLKGLGLQNQLDAAAENPDVGFVDTLSPYLGVEWWIVERFALRLGYSFHATPVPLQSGDTNLLDGNTHVVGAGVAVNFDDPLEVFARPIFLEVAVQEQLIPERRANKPATVSVPSYVYGGSVTAVTGALRYEF
jgi:long-subunit fatty acid transport protein